MTRAGQRCETRFASLSSAGYVPIQSPQVTELRASTLAYVVPSLPSTIFPVTLSAPSGWRRYRVRSTFRKSGGYRASSFCHTIASAVGLILDRLFDQANRSEAGRERSTD